MDLNWANLRILNGSQRESFEELCSQLAREEAPEEAEFVRKGSPDSGVECYCRFENGQEWGWQAKFFLPSLGQTQWNQLDRSVERALEAHPNLVRYFVCAPRNRSDGRREGITTEMQRWETQVAKWEGWAVDRGMAVEFVWWGSSELIDLLSQESNGGRSLFWFGATGQFSSEWFDKHLRRAIEAAGPRYTPEVHVDVPLLEDLELFGRSDFACSAVRDVAKNIRQTPTYMLRRLAGEDATTELAAAESVAESVENVVEALYDMRCPPNDEWPFSEVIDGIRDARNLLGESEAPLSDAAEEFKQRNNAEKSSPATQSNPYSEAAYQVRALERVLWGAFDTLWGFDQVVNSNLMVITGKAGSGKTHLLCDMAKRRLADRRPTVVLMGQQFTTTDPPWMQARAQLDLGDISLEHFVGALEAAAQAA
ncbi:MAG: ATP-binding protein, partial [Acidimicrobiia bacterium]|nr:ATP-binding protein [Acidimicrobiia bacterium]